MRSMIKIMAAHSQQKKNVTRYLVIYIDRCYRRGLRQRVASLTLNCNGDFAIRAYDLPNCVHSSTIRLFADDLIYKEIHSQQHTEDLETDLDALQTWERRWLMSFHPQKYQLMRITRKPSPIIATYNIHGHVADRLGDSAGTKSQVLGKAMQPSVVSHMQGLWPIGMASSMMLSDCGMSSPCHDVVTSESVDVFKKDYL